MHRSASYNNSTSSGTNQTDKPNPEESINLIWDIIAKAVKYFPKPKLRFF